MAWHHIIPFALLRAVWNRLVDRHIATQNPEARVAIRQYLQLADRTLPELEALIDRMRAENTYQRRTCHHQLEPLSVFEALQLATAAVWPAWNAVEGPRQRSDDPHDHYFDRFTVGLKLEERARMRAIEELFGAFQLFIGAGPVPDANSLRSLARAASQARPSLICDLPIRYRPEMWVQDGAGLWCKRRNEDRGNAAGG